MEEEEEEVGEELGEELEVKEKEKEELERRPARRADCIKVVAVGIRVTTMTRTRVDC